MLSLLAGAAPARAQDATVVGIVQRMVAADAGVRSYTASVHADIAMHSFPFISPSLDGTYYHKEPNENKIVFTSGLPYIAREFSKIYPDIESPSHWFTRYYVTLEDTDGTYTTLKLVPRKHGRIDHIDAKIDNATTDLVQLRWNYNDGGYATLNQTYGVVGGHRLVTEQTGHIDATHYNADLKSTFTAFRINVDIPDSVFANNG
jgi:hypothetical protein